MDRRTRHARQFLTVRQVIFISHLKCTPYSTGKSHRQCLVIYLTFVFRGDMKMRDNRGERKARERKARSSAFFAWLVWKIENYKHALTVAQLTLKYTR